MALPVTINKANPAGSDLASTYDDVMRTLKENLEDLFGVPDATAISAALMEVIAGGLKNVRFADAAADPATAGFLQRSGTTLKYYTGSAVKDLTAPIDETQGTRNGLINGDQEDWRNGTSVAAFGWVLTGAGATVARDGTNFATGTYAASITRAGADCQYERDAITEMGGQSHIRGKTVAFHARVRATVAGRVRLRINDGVSSVFSSYHTGGGSFETLKVPATTLAALATALKCGLQIDTGDTTAQIDTCMLVFGGSYVAFQLRGEISVFRQVFTASGTYTKASNLVATRVIGAGGGAAGGAGEVVGSTRASGGGGGSGGYSESVLVPGDIGATEAVTIASAAASSFGALVIANAGSAGAAGSGTTGGDGGAGATAGTGQIALPGSDGQSGHGFDSAGVGGLVINPKGGSGGPSALGGAGRSQVAGKANTGGGGGGGNGVSGQTAAGGGSTGIVVVHEMLVL